MTKSAPKPDPIKPATGTLEDNGLTWFQHDGQLGVCTQEFAQDHPSPKTQPKQKRKSYTIKAVPEFSPFEVEQHAMANKAMSFIYSPC